VVALTKDDAHRLAKAVHVAVWKDTLSPKHIQTLPQNLVFAWKCRVLLPANLSNSITPNFVPVAAYTAGKSTKLVNYWFWKCRGRWMEWEPKNG
jgi:hypothetical protein